MPDNNMPLLNPTMKQKIITDCNRVHMSVLLHYVLSGELSVSEMPDLCPERLQAIEEKKKTLPNPREQIDWNELSSNVNFDNKTLEEILQHKEKTNAYIAKWGAINPPQNHLADAKQLLSSIKNALVKLEETEWANVSLFEEKSLLDHLTKFEASAHMDVIDDSLWIVLDTKDKSKLDIYLKYFSPNGKHVSEAQKMKADAEEWESIKNDLAITDDTEDEYVFNVRKYIKEHPSSSFLPDANAMLEQLKQREFNIMREDPAKYSIERLKKLLNEKIIAKHELINHQIISEKALEKLLSSQNVLLPNIREVIAQSRIDVGTGNGNTDIFLFGIPATGKTCVIMGLASAQSLQVSLIGGGGDYASALQQYIDEGRTVPRTPGDFVTTINAKISDEKGEHYINIVEMSGEEFAYDIVHNPDKIVNFDQMGSGTMEILKNNNRKVFFLIIDPTAETVKVKRDIISKNEYGNQYVAKTEELLVNQRATLNKLVNMFEAPENADIMEKVDAIHFIMTKSDLLDKMGNRDEIAMSIFDSVYRQYILTPLIDVCKRFNINDITDFQPKLFTFSLGDFSLGGLFTYREEDSNDLVNAIKNVTHKVTKEDFWDKMCNFFN